MSQKRAISALEAFTNVTIGWVVAFVTQLVLFPVVGLSVTFAQHVSIGAGFTAVSFLRSYILRRLFDRLACRQSPEGGGSKSSRPATGPAGAAGLLRGHNSDRGSKPVMKTGK